MKEDRLIKEIMDAAKEILSPLYWSAEGRGNYHSREAQVPSVLEMLGIPYSGLDPQCLAICLDKPLTKKLVAVEGLCTPRWQLVTETRKDCFLVNHLQHFILTFVPLFIVIDALGNLPFVISLSEGMTKQERHKMIHVAAITATIVGLVFLFFGQFILQVMNISVGSFAIAGGLILLVFSVKYMTTGRMVEMIKEEMIAVVPIGTPLTVGPATITTLLLLATQFSLYMVLLSFSLNMLITWIIFLLGGQVVHFLGQDGLKAISKVFSLLLAAIAVSMIIRGLELVGIIKDVAF